MCAALYVLAAASPVLAAGTAITDNTIEANAAGLNIEFQLSQGVPFRIALHDSPPRLAVELDGPTTPGALHGSVRTQALANGGLRLETDLPGPMAVERAVMSVVPHGPGTRLAVRLRRVSSADFAALVIPEPSTAPVKRPTGPARRLVVALDPGHGGHDPGATHGRLHEADLVLSFARELKEDLLRTTDFDVVLTRTQDRFVPLHERLAIARRAGADAFLSLHADGIARGSASGATIFTHAERASNPVSARLARAHRRSELLGGVDLSGQSDALAVALMDLARQDTAHRSHDLADALVGAMDTAEIPLYKHPRQRADFVVLRAPDMPSALVELGFLSEAADRGRLSDPGWRARMAAALRRGLLDWTRQDAALAALRLR